MPGNKTVSQGCSSHHSRVNLLTTTPWSPWLNKARNSNGSWHCDVDVQSMSWLLLSDDGVWRVKCCWLLFKIYQDCLLCLISILLLCHWSDSFFDGFPLIVDDATASTCLFPSCRVNQLQSRQMSKNLRFERQDNQLRKTPAVQAMEEGISANMKVL